MCERSIVESVQICMMTTASITTRRFPLCADMIRSALDNAIEDGSCWKEADDLLRLVYAAIDSLVSVWPCDCEWGSGWCRCANRSLCVPLIRQYHLPSLASAWYSRAQIEHHHCSPIKSSSQGKSSRTSCPITLTLPDLEHYIAELKRTREKGMRAWLSGVGLPPPQWGGALGLARRGAGRS